MAVHLSAVAGGPSGLRQIQSRSQVLNTERIVFWVETVGPGTLTLTGPKQGQIFPVGDQPWTVQAGTHAP